jgi:hypothetical protein
MRRNRKLTKHIAGYGDIRTRFFDIDGKGENTTKDFLSKLVEKIVVRMTGYFDETEARKQADYIFAYGEKQLNSAICPSIADLTRGYIIEYPLDRKPPGQKRYLGHADYWVSYGGISYLIELKHSFIAVSQDEPGKYAIPRFRAAIRQLKQITEKERRNLLKYDKSLFDIALEVITFYQNDPHSVNFKNIKQTFRNLTDYPSIKKRLSMSSLWLLDRKKIKPIKYDDGSQIYPAVAFIANVSRHDIEREL